MFKSQIIKIIIIKIINNNNSNNNKNISLNPDSFSTSSIQFHLLPSVADFDMFELLFPFPLFSAATDFKSFKTVS